MKGFLTAVLIRESSGVGYVCMAYSDRKRPRNGKPDFHEQYFRTDELDKIVDWALKQDAIGRDVYFCAHTLNRMERKKSATRPLAVCHTSPRPPPCASRPSSCSPLPP